MASAEMGSFKGKDKWYDEKAAAIVEQAREWELIKVCEGPQYYAPPYQLRLHRRTRAFDTILDQLFKSIADAVSFTFQHYADSDVESGIVFMTKTGMNVWMMHLDDLRIQKGPEPIKIPGIKIPDEIRPEEMPPPWMHNAKAI